MDSHAVNTAKLATWNLQWGRRQSPRGKEMRRIIGELVPDVVCITEGHADFMAGSGYTESADGDTGYPVQEGRRKAIIWSRQPWRKVDATGDPGMPGGRFVTGITSTPVGDVRIVGVCIPWSAAHVSTGTRDRIRWQDHLAYLEGLGRYLSTLPEDDPVVVLGDFNQAIPRRRAPAKVFEALMQALGTRYRVVTDGRIEPVDSYSIDHIALSPELRAIGVTGLSNKSSDGRDLSDHFGIFSKIAISGSNKIPD
jgi:endonuclease/exonuclease/phosphatase family metal-dependent hydrolase